jgi:hypothetical protein
MPTMLQSSSEADSMIPSHPRLSLEPLCLSYLGSLDFNVSSSSDFVGPLDFLLNHDKG